MQISSHIADQVKRVLIFPAQVPTIADRQVYFLFSIRQMEDILMTASIMPVPFSGPYIKGIAPWRDNAVPVISLEECLGLESSHFRNDSRLIVIQAPPGDTDQRNCGRIMLQAVAPIRILTLPIDCRPVPAEWIPAGHLARGVYEWENKLLVAAHIAKILAGAFGNR